MRRAEPDLPASGGTTAAGQVAPSTATPAPACTHHGSLRTANAIAAPGNCGRSCRPSAPTPTPLPPQPPPRSSRAPSTQKGGLGPPPAQGTDRTHRSKPTLRHRSDATSPRHTRQHHGRHRGPTRAHRASPSRRCSTRAWGPAAVPVPRQHRSVPRHRHGFWQEPDSQHPRPAPPRQEHPPPGRGGHNQHRPGRGRRVRRRAPVRLCAARAGGSAGRAAPPREALPLGQKKVIA